MAHELKRVSYATCDPDFRLFAFVAREPAADPANRQYCHIFKTDTPEQVFFNLRSEKISFTFHFFVGLLFFYSFEAEEINSIFGSAFRAALVEKRKYYWPKENIYSNTVTKEEEVVIYNNEKFIKCQQPTDKIITSPVLVRTILKVLVV